MVNSTLKIQIKRQNKDLDKKSPKSLEADSAILSDSSGDEGVSARIGKVPLEWYKNYDHIGYDKDGKKVRPLENKDLNLLEKAKHNDWVIYDEYNDKKIHLSESDLRAIRKIRHNKFPAISGFFDPYPEYNFGNGEKYLTSWRSADTPKSSYTPSKHERKAVVRLVHALKNGWISVDGKPTEKEKERKKKKAEEEIKSLDLWGEQEEVKRNGFEEYLEGTVVFKRTAPYVPPPPLALPGHAESYNPPAEYLLDETEEKEWEEMDPEGRETDFMPKKYRAMRLIPSNSKAFEESYKRALEIFSKSRGDPKKKKRELPKTAEELIPKIDPNDYKPFPSKLGIRFSGHYARVVTLSVSQDGQWLASGAENGEAKLWEIESGRCLKTITFSGDETIKKVEFSPKGNALGILKNSSGRSKLSIFAAKSLGLNVDESEEERSLWELVRKNLEQESGEGFKGKNAKILQSISYKISSQPAENLEESSQKIKSQDISPVIEISAKSTAVSFAWHPSGSHVALVLDCAPFLFVQKLKEPSRCQTPFPRLKRKIVDVLFAKKKRLLFAVFEKNVMVYDYAEGRRYLSLKWGDGRLSSAALSPSDEQLLVGCYDRSVHFFDFELSSKPYSFNCHSRSVRGVAHHSKRPLFASASADESLCVFHAKVFEDFGREPEIVPVNLLEAGVGSEKEKSGILEAQFHPTQPWLFCCGARGNSIEMFVDE